MPVLCLYGFLFAHTAQTSTIVAQKGKNLNEVKYSGFYKPLNSNGVKSPELIFGGND
jgi:hypothetical protein